jgi:Holliday junction DNA helicase RuvA
MIAWLAGRLVQKDLPIVVIDTGGVGYAVEVPLSTYADLPQAGEKVALHIHTLVREDAILLFGFRSTGERSIFRRLIAISGIGPRIALAVIGGMQPGEMLHAIDAGEIDRFIRIPGVGRKTAERLIIELRDKLGLLQGEMEPGAMTSEPGAVTLIQDVISAMENLGFKRPTAEKAARSAAAEVGPDASFEAVLKKTLTILNRQAN